MPEKTDGSAARTAGGEWMLVAYRAPKEPSTARVAAWRRLHRLGALYVGPSVCLIPSALLDGTALGQVADGVRSAGGTFDLLNIQAFAAGTEKLLADRFNSARDAEYAEIVERAEALQAELEREGRRGKFTFAEVEENEADLAKLRRWLDTVGRRDVFGAGGRPGAQEAVRAAADALERFTRRSAELEEEAMSSPPSGGGDGA